MDLLNREGLLYLISKIKEGVDGALKIGETSDTAYRGDRGKEAYDHAKSPHAPSDAEPNVQADWDEEDSSSDAYVQNKPESIKNPFSITFTGAVNETYDGSAAVTIDIPNALKGTNDYSELINKPKINTVELNGEKTLEEIGIEELSNTDMEEIIKRLGGL